MQYSKPFRLRRKNPVQFSGNRSVTLVSWSCVPWKKVNEQVTRLQRQIYLAKLRGNLLRLRRLQLKAVNSKFNLLAAIRRVTSVNRGKKTAGIDNQVYLTPERRFSLFKELVKVNFLDWVPSPVRRVEVPRPGKTPRPLGIPIVKDRVIQAVIKASLEPEWETTFEHGSYGFRPVRSSHDAMARIWRLVSKKKRLWVLDADIRGCFNEIGHDPLLEQLRGFPAKDLIGRWLKAGYFLGQEFHTTNEGTPQGGIISPLLANIALHGMEALLGVRYHVSGYVRSECPWVPVRYADDFLVFANTKASALEAQEKLGKWLASRGMVFAEDKTAVRKVEDGFDFLGFNFRLFKNRQGSRKHAWERAKGDLVSLVQPSKKSVQTLFNKARDLWHSHIGKEAWLLITKLNQLLKGWATYHRYGNANETFRKIDHFMYLQAVRYLRRKHPQKSWAWVRSRYFKDQTVHRPCKTGRRSKASTNWSFTDKGLHLYQLRFTPLGNYPSVAYGKNPFSPLDKDYYFERRAKFLLQKDSFRGLLFAEQYGLCPLCGARLVEDWGEPLHLHHLIPRKAGGTNHPDNLMLLHEECHYNCHKQELTKVALETKLHKLLVERRLIRDKKS